MEIKINGKKYQAQEKETILDVCRREGIGIPTLCAHGKLKREAVCRLCLVEINFTDKLVPSCAFQVCDKLEVVTESEKIKKAREINLELLWSDHAGKCVKCKKNRACELQKLAEEHKIDNFHFVPRKEDLTPREELDLLKDNRIRVVVDDNNPAISRTTEFCVECRRCINICPVKSYGFNNRAGDVVVGTPYEEALDCIFCGACVKNCPTAAIVDKNDFNGMENKLNDLNTLAVAIIDPAVMESIGDEIPEIDSIEKMAGFLKFLGFERVFSSGWGMEKYCRELFKELKNDKIVISSHCPAINLFIKKYHPKLKEYVSGIKNPDESTAAFIKGEYAKKEKINPKNICVVSISSCVAKKAERSQKIDYILTVREIGRYVREKKIDASSIKTARLDQGLEFDEKYLDMIRSGGLAGLMVNDEKAGRDITTKAANKMEEIKEIQKDIDSKKESYDFIEMMICPGGCVHGGGQSIKVKDKK